MASPIDAFVSGQYLAFWAQPNVDGLNFPRYISQAGQTLIDTGTGSIPSFLGATQQGFTLSTIMHGERVRGDFLGQSTVDIIYQGADIYLQWNSISFRPGSVQTMWPWGLLGNVGTLGRLGSVTGGTLFLAAAPLTTATGTPLIGQVVINALTARNAILAENLEQSLLFDNRLRTIPVRMRLLPFLSMTYQITNTSQYFTGTSIQPIPISTGFTGSNQTSAFMGLPYEGLPATQQSMQAELTSAPGNLFDPTVGTGIAGSGANVTLITQGLQGQISGGTQSGNPYSNFPLYSWYTII